MATLYRSFATRAAAEIWAWKVGFRRRRWTAGTTAIRPFLIEEEASPSPRSVVHVPDAWQAGLNAWETAQLSASKPGGFAPAAALQRRHMVVGAYDLDRNEPLYAVPGNGNVETLRGAIEALKANGMHTCQRYDLGGVTTRAAREAHLTMLQEEEFLCGIEINNNLSGMAAELDANFAYLATPGTTADGNDADRCREAMAMLYCGHEVWENSVDGITRAARDAQVAAIEAAFGDVIGFFYPFSSDSGAVTNSNSRLTSEKNGSLYPVGWREPHVFLSQGPYGTVPSSAQKDLNADRALVDANCAGLRACLLNAMTSATSDNIRDALINCDKAGFHLVLVRACDDAIAPADITAATLSGIAAYNAARPTTPVP